MAGGQTEVRSAVSQQVLLTPSSDHEAIPIELDRDQAEIVSHPGHAVVVGGPGTGKTTTMIEWVAHRAENGSLERILVLTHARAGAQDLRARLVRRLNRSTSGSTVMTVHGLCLALLRRFAGVDDADPPRLLMAPEQDFRIRELLSGYPTDNWPTDLAQAAQTRGLAGEMRTVLSTARQRTLDPADLRDLGHRWASPTWSAVGDFFENYLDVLDAEGVIDYGELVHRARLLLLDEQVQAALRADYDAVVVDEFAECDPSQVALIGQLAHIGLTTVAFADPSTRVFGFRGADPRGVETLMQHLATTQPVGAGVGHFALSRNHRAGGRLADAVANVRDRLPLARGGNHGGLSVADQIGERAGRVSAPSHRGRVSVQIFDSAGAEADHIAHQLRAAHLDDGLAWPDMAVICRTGRGSLPALSRALTASGIPVEVAGDEMPLSDEAAVRPLLWGLEAALALSQGQPLEPDHILRLLRSPLGGLDSVAIRRFARELRRPTLSADLDGDGAPDELPQPSAQAIAEVLLTSARQPHQVPDSAQDSTTIESDDESADDPAELAPGAVGAAESSGSTAERDAVVSLGRLLGVVSEAISRGVTAHVALWELWNGSSWPQVLQAAALAPSETSRRAHRDLDAVCALFDLAAREQELTGERGVRGLLTEVQGQAIPADTMRESNVRRRGVRLLTAHRAKGQEWPFVVVAGVQEGTWPVIGRRGRLIDADELNPDRREVHGPAPANPAGEVLADERRLFLLAISRASKKLLVTAASGTEGEHDQPSRFLRDLGVEPEVVRGRPRRALTLTSLTGELRRVASDPQSTPGLRSAAAARLAVLSQATDRGGRRLAPGADPRSWWGVEPITDSERPVLAHGRPIELSGSSLEAILQCPRQWFLSRRVKADSPRSSAQSLGSLLHVLVQHAVSDGLELPTLGEHLERVWDQVPFDAQWVAASERAEADAALERFAAWHEMYQGRRVLGVEVPFRQPVLIDGQRVDLIGSVDRLELDAEGRLRIVDFKTGRSMPTVAQAAASNQLGLYQLAAMSGAFEQLAPGVREVAGADLVYLRRNDGTGAPFPKVLTQPSLHDQPHGKLVPGDMISADAPPGAAADGVDETAGQAAPERPTWVHDRIAEAVTIVRTENFCAVSGDACQWCPFAVGCPAKGKEWL